MCDHFTEPTKPFSCVHQLECWSRRPQAGKQLLATVISTASQIQMEKRSHSVAPLIMYGTDGAARLWTTGGPSHVPAEPSGNVLQITHVSPRFTKHLYLAPHSQRRKVS